MFSRLIRWHRPCNNFRGVIQRSMVRFESTVSQNATDSVKANSVSTATSKATDSLSRAASAAGPALKGVGKTLSSIGGQTGQVISLLQRHIPTTVYYTRVGLELSKLVFHGRNMVPPPLSTFQSYFQRLLRNPGSILSSISLKNPKEILQRARSLSSGELAYGMVLFAELLGFFTVGEIIGRFKLIGYNGEITHHH